ncbi:wax ester/triacylglycerol synthase family O-acyltransferase [Yimella sp. RIT 621]|uniref:WS/DGAT/MGAT family O-acyltransferase n=1 Tax=Yimella sp. RIT 621 TaxID=2510323 RepID=UPI00101D8C39|nr:wax ester/triacylglycerol synthase family O-acyltransferase [Yimella sp. RIT 621]RYG76915.1 wax ester/triacylglycerol synthase family O-acyltransferase [Yimella sp. RIT 621]
MADRLTSLDASFLYLEDATTPMHVGSVMVFDPPAEGFEYDNIIDLVSNRIAYVPRYRQRVRHTPGRISNPVWVDDQDFDITYHVRRSALPKPGNTAQLEEFVGRIQSRALDRDRPLWELYLVEGLERGRFAIVTKTHQALVDGVNAIDIGQVIVDSDAGREDQIPHTWRARPEPSAIELVADSIFSMLRSPGRVIREGVEVLTDVHTLGRRVAGTATDLLGVLARSTALRAPSSPLNAQVSGYRRYVMLESELADYQKVRTRITADSSNEHVTVHDVVLAAVAGGLRAWLMSRGQAVDTGATIRAMVPVSTHSVDDDPDQDQVTACFIDLPVGEPNARMRLHQVAYAMQQQVDSRTAVGARSLSGLSGFAPPTLHSLGARLGGVMSRRMFNLVITNVPGPQHELYAADAEMIGSYPVIPIAKGQALAIGLTSYNGKVFFGLTADRDSMPDVEMLGQCVEEALAELVSES